MTFAELQIKSINELSKIARTLDIPGVTKLNKGDLIFRILQAQSEKAGEIFAEARLEVFPDGYGFLRSPDYDFQESPDDIYVAPSQIRKFELKDGDWIAGRVRPPLPGEKYFALTQPEVIGAESLSSAFQNKEGNDDLLPEAGELSKARDRLPLQIRPQVSPPNAELAQANRMQHPDSPQTGRLPQLAQHPVRVFVSYSHQDAKYLERESLLGYLAALEREGFAFWYDKNIAAGDPWDAQIKEEIDRSDVALILVSQAFLNSRYCMDEEVVHFLARRKQNGLLFLPIVTSPCDWKSHTWIASVQCVPRDGKTVATHFKTKGARDGLYLEILQQLRGLGNVVREGRK
jgi:hypothetical protein